MGDGGIDAHCAADRGAAAGSADDSGVIAAS